MSDVVHVPDRKRFELREGDDVAVLTYRQGDDDVTFLHTVVPPPMEGRGVAGRLAEEGVRWARAQGAEVVPVCDYVRGWLERHPEALQA